MEEKSAGLGYSVEMIMFYNTENFFGPDLPSSSNSKSIASGLRKWDERKFRNKLVKIAHVFELAKEMHGVLPMFIGLAEVQGEEVLSHLTRLEVFEGNYDFIHYESMDERGVDVALLYDKTKVEIIASKPFSYFFEIEDSNPENYDTTRDVLWVKVKYKDELINVLVLHLPSKRERDINLPKRNYIINDVKGKVIKMMGENEAVLMMGDFNENPDEGSLKNLIYDDEFKTILTNPFSEVYKNKNFSTFHYKSGLLFDQIILSNDFFNPRFPLYFSEASVFAPSKISNWDRKFLGRPFRTYAGTRYLGGYSDHFPVLVKFKN